MAEEMNNEQWLERMQEKLFKIIDNSNDLFDIFQTQGKKDKNIVNIHEKTDHFANISSDELLYVADSLSNLVYATPLLEYFFYVKTDEDREMLFFTNEDERAEYQMKNNNCQFVYLRFRDFFTLIDYFDLDLLTVTMTNYVLNFSRANIESFYNIVAYENINNESNYVIGQPSESYEKAIEQLTPKFKELEELKNVWLYHILELKKKTSAAVNDKYEEMYDVIVVEMPESNYISLRDLTNKIVQSTNNHSVKVVLHNSDLGMMLLNTTTTPIYSKS